jgi:transglutaminase-like putative cysteine protease
VRLLVVLLVLKLASARSERDWMQVQVLAFLEVLAASVLSTSASYFAFLAAFLVFAVAAFALAEILRSARQPRRIIRHGLDRFGRRLAALTLVVCTGILLVTALFFFFLPRTGRAIVAKWAPRQLFLPGFSNEVTLGQIGEVQQSSATVLHARVMNVAGPQPLRWRGNTLAEFDGRRWFNSDQRTMFFKAERGLIRLADYRPQDRPGRSIAYDVQLKALTSDALFMAGIPEFLQILAPGVLRTPAGAYRVAGTPGEFIRYRVYAYLPDSGDATIFPALDEQERALYLRLPPLDPRVAELARGWSAGLSEPAAIGRALEARLRGAFPYTLDLPATPPADPVAHFLFERKKGHCEYFASALAVMLRTRGVPSRVATGFLTGEFNPVSGWHRIRASDAHSWVEAYIEGRGWATLDPTPPAATAPEQNFWQRAAFYADAMETFWQDWVLNYNLEQQLMLAARVEQSGRNAGLSGFARAGEAISRGLAWAKERALVLAPWVFALVLAAVAGRWLAAPLREWLHRRRQRSRLESGQASPHDATLLYQRLLDLLAARGYVRPAWMTPLEFADSLPPGEGTEAIEDITRAYVELRFGADGRVAGRMVTLLETLESRNG